MDLATAPFMPHGMCFLWNPRLLALNVVSDSATVLAYFSMPATLLYFVRKRRTVPFGWLLLMFALFIVACGTSHALDVWTIWHPDYWIDGGAKAATAVASIATAAALFPTLPKLLAMRFPVELDALNAQLTRSLAEKETLLAAYERAERVSSRFQQAALPARLPQVAGFRFDASYLPADDEAHIGGDWYDAMRLADGRIVISIGDVSGSGLGAAITMAAMRQVIRGVAYVHPDPVMILDAAGRTLCEEFPDDQVSAFVGVIDPTTLVLTYASAGHPSPVLRMPDSTIEELPYDGTILGVRAAGEQPSQRRQLVEGALLVLYTDGLIEPDPIEGERRIAQSMQDPRVVQTDNVAQALEHAMLSEQSRARDDVAVLVVCVERSPFRVKRGNPACGVSRWEFDACDPGAAQLARTAFTDDLRDVTSLTEDLFTAELVFGELVGNVARYAAGPVEVLVDWMGSAPVLHVRDRGPGFTHIPKLPRDIMAENGRGLYIISALTNEFDVERAPDGGSHARAVLSLSRRRLTRRANSLPNFAIELALDKL